MLTTEPKWTIKNTSELYNISQWSEGYFDINAHGHLEAHPDGDKNKPGIDLVQLTQTIKDAGLRLPVLVRFTEILQHRLQNLQQSFANAISDLAYQNTFTAVYPIKVNQQHDVVSHLLQDTDQQFGLEAGSKPELMAVLSALQDSNRVVICNGYKDRNYIRLALIGQLLGHRVYLIIEKYSELAIILDEAKKLNITPRLGVRVRLSSIAKGKWQNTGGEKSKFGLTCAQVLQVLDDLTEQHCLSALQLVHFHLGSQISNIRDIQRGLRECARFYSELFRAGADIQCIDVGGGLGVDYEGTHTRNYCSINYNVQEYANNVVNAFAEICNTENLPHPHIITESGRALTAHHAMLITNLVDVEVPESTLTIAPVTATAPMLLQDLWDAYQHVHERNLIETYHDICHWQSEAQDSYIHGVFNLAQRAQAEELYILTCRKLQHLLMTNHRSRAHQDILSEINEKLADKFFVNFSLFQSLPDVWAIDQIFPVLPLNHLDKEPTRRGVLQDLTCDSDGRIDFYVDGQGIETTLPLVPYQKNEPYFLGIFLVGAYQEILGDVHNLFGDTDSVLIQRTPTGEVKLIHPRFGDSISDVLRFVHFSADEMLASYSEQCNRAGVSEQQRQLILQELTYSLKSYTYLDLP